MRIDGPKKHRLLTMVVYGMLLILMGGCNLTGCLTGSCGSPAPPEAIAPFAANAPGGRTVEFEPSVDRSIVGRIEIPRIDLKAMIREGVTQRTLALAVGHIPGTALPGRTGNVGIAGHRDTFFRGLQSVHTGDAIILTTLEGSYEYRVESAEVVAPGDTRVLADSTQPELTLVTCYPFYFVGSAPLRYIVHASTTSAINLRAPRPRIHSGDRGVRDSSSAAQSPSRPI